MNKTDHIFYVTQEAADVAEDHSWLTPDERAVLHGLRFPKRRDDWVLGRWTAKQTLLRYFELNPAGIGQLEILAAPDGAPRVAVNGVPCQLRISISHSAQRAICAVSSGKVAIGCDIEHVEPRDASFAETFLTPREQHWVRTTPASIQPLAITLIWSAKESVLKATHEGLRADTWSVNVARTGLPGRAGWQPLHATRLNGDQGFSGWWHLEDDIVLTVAANAALSKPIALKPGSDPPQRAGQTVQHGEMERVGR